MLTENNSRRGLVAVGASWFLLSAGSTLTVRENSERGVQIAENSNAEILGTVLVEDNSTIGLFINISSSLSVGESASLTVKGTEGYGILITELSTLKAWAGSILVENNTGSNGYGILAVRSSNVTLQGPTTSAIIRNNDLDGIAIYQHSSGRFDAGTEITGNGWSGLIAGDNSMLMASGSKVQNNRRWGVSADDGSTANFRDCIITGNGPLLVPDPPEINYNVRLSFGSRGTLNENTIGGDLPITCEGPGVISRGNPTCPQ